MPSRTQIVCLHEGEKGHSIDPVFINRLIRSLAPSWLRPWGSNVVSLKACGGRKDLIRRFPDQLRICLAMGSDTTLMVWADLDDDMADGEQLKAEFWAHAQADGVSRAAFDQAVFILAKDRIENWVQFLRTGQTDEAVEGPRVKHDKEVADAARALAARCQQTPANAPELPPSLKWSCKNWHALVDRARK